MRLNGSFARASIVAFSVACSLAVPVTARGAEARPSTASVVDVSSIRIDNFGRVNSNYYRGAQPSGRDYADLAALGVKTVINLTSDDADATEKSMAEHAGMKYVQIPMTTHTVPTSAELAQFLDIADNPANQPIYVHCVGGRHRTGVMTAVYRMAQDGWTADQAFREMKQYKFGADFLHSEFKEFVYAYRVDSSRRAASRAVVATQIGR